MLKTIIIFIWNGHVLIVIDCGKQLLAEDVFFWQITFSFFSYLLMSFYSSKPTIRDDQNNKLDAFTVNKLQAWKQKWVKLMETD